MVAIASAIRDATPDQPMGVPPRPPVVGLYAYRRWQHRDRGAGVICLAYNAYGWEAFFLALGAANFAGGYWYLSIDRSASA